MTTDQSIRLARLFRVALITAFIYCCVRTLSAAEPSLADVAEHRDRAQLQRLVLSKADVNATQVDGMTALHWACYHSDAQSVLLLAAAGADVNAKTRYGVTPLSLACTNGDGEIVETLLQAGADANLALPGEETPLMTAARTGVLKPVQLLLAHGAKVDAVQRNNQNALMWAAAEGHVEVVDALLNAGADPNVTLRSGFNAWFFAIRAGHAPVVRRLLAAGVDVTQGIEFTRAYARAPRRGSSGAHIAVLNGHYELALELLRAGIDPNDLRSGYTVLHEIVWVRKPNRGDGERDDPTPETTGSVDSLEFVRQAVKLGADVNALAQRGAAGSGRLSYIGSTPFFCASVTADLPLLKTLVELGADPNIANRDNTTPLLACAGAGSQAPQEEAGSEDEVLACLDYMLSLGADVNHVDEKGETSMHAAAYRCMPRVVHYLAAKGAKVEVWNKANRQRWTPLMIAQGYRPGNFKPDRAVIKAIEEELLAGGAALPGPDVVAPIQNPYPNAR